MLLFSSIWILINKWRMSLPVQYFCFISWCERIHVYTWQKSVIICKLHFLCRVGRYESTPAISNPWRFLCPWFARWRNTMEIINTWKVTTGNPVRNARSIITIYSGNRVHGHSDSTVYNVWWQCDGRSTRAELVQNGVMISKSTYFHAMRPSAAMATVASS